MAIYIIIENKQKKSKVKLSKDGFILGRSRKSNIKIDDELLSGQHCALQLNHDGYAFIKDLGSTNGTYVNSFKIDSRQIFLDDVVVIGKVRMWLSERDMNEQEKEMHTTDNENKTNIQYISLGKEFEYKSNKKILNTPSAEDEDGDEDKDHPSIIVDSDFNQINDEEEEEEEKQPPKKKIAEKPEADFMLKERKIDLGKPTGATSQIEVDIVPEKKPVERRVRPAKDLKKKKSLFGAIKNLLKKNDNDDDDDIEELDPS